MSVKPRTLVTGCALPKKNAGLGLQPVPAANSANLWNEAFKAVGWQVAPPLLDITTKQLIGALNDLAKTPGPVVWVWVGHGLQVWDVNYDEPDYTDEALLTYDTDLNEVSTWFVDDDIYNSLGLRAASPHTTLVILDACHSAGWLSDRIKPLRTTSSSTEFPGIEWRVISGACNIVSVAMASEQTQAWYMSYRYGQLLCGTWSLGTLLLEMGRRGIASNYKIRDWLYRGLRRLGSPPPVIESGDEVIKRSVATLI